MDAVEAGLGLVLAVAGKVEGEDAQGSMGVRRGGRDLDILWEEGGDKRVRTEHVQKGRTNKTLYRIRFKSITLHLNKQSVGQWQHLLG